MEFPGIYLPGRLSSIFWPLWVKPSVEPEQPVGGWKSSSAPLAVGNGSQVCTALWRSCLLPGVIKNNLKTALPAWKCSSLSCLLKTNFPQSQMVVKRAKNMMIFTPSPSSRRGREGLLLVSSSGIWERRQDQWEGELLDMTDPGCASCLPRPL